MSRCPGQPASGRSRCDVATAVQGEDHACLPRADRSPWRFSAPRRSGGPEPSSFAIARLDGPFICRRRSRQVMHRRFASLWGDVPLPGNRKPSTAWPGTFSRPGNAHGILTLRSLAPAGDVRGVSTWSMSVHPSPCAPARHPHLPFCEPSHLDLFSSRNQPHTRIRLCRRPWNRAAWRLV